MLEDLEHTGNLQDKTSNHRKLSVPIQTKNKERKKKKKINPVTFKNAISGIPSATFDGIHTHMVLFVKNHE